MTCKEPRCADQEQHCDGACHGVWPDGTKKDFDVMEFHDVDANSVFKDPADIEYKESMLKMLSHLFTTN